ncbi:Similar to hypothetical protein [Tuber melanosporum Mel28]; acc. no. XP_002841286 [Pyronema omphalodes CBS 100304]|uniref:Rhodopsin domain-containing protein n=1 Tax=Pyronema omphalodes (strain CBS 100304) TaxID=1076935 RepID=U4LGH4_PYROM|nr:Similar to hypothetical protein [Tuber melanosporum Mel28]; acc. no. XP_002841286 [Pyronema omphalodes CBS 100304]
MSDELGLGPTLLGVMFSLTTLSTIIVILRFYCRAKIIGSVTIDDYLIGFALVQTWGLCVSNYFHVYYGTGKHAQYLTNYMEIIIPTLKLWYAYQLQYLMILYTVKVSILCFYYRLSPQKLYRWSVWGLGGLITAYTVAMFFVNMFECPEDITRAWAITFPQGCNNLVTVYYAMAAFNIFTDILIFILPLPTVMSLQVNKRKRGALLLIFSVGSLAIIASIVRINALYKYMEAAMTGGDIPYVAAYILIWSQVEVNMAISSASGPSLKPLVKSVLGGTSFNKSSYYLRGGSSRSKPQSTPNGHRIYGNDRSAMGRSTDEERDVPLGNYKGHVRSTAIHSSSANTSQENIINSSMGGIMRTTDVKVDVELGIRSKNDSEDSLRRLEYGN